MRTPERMPPEMAPSEMAPSERGGTQQQWLREAAEGVVTTSGSAPPSGCSSLPHGPSPLGLSPKKSDAEEAAGEAAAAAVAAAVADATSASQPSAAMDAPGVPPVECSSPTNVCSFPPTPVAGGAGGARVVRSQAPPSSGPPSSGPPSSGRSAVGGRAHIGRSTSGRSAGMGLSPPPPRRKLGKQALAPASALPGTASSQSSSAFETPLHGRSHAVSSSPVSSPSAKEVEAEPAAVGHGLSSSSGDDATWCGSLGPNSTPSRKLKASTRLLGNDDLMDAPMDE